MLTALPPSAGGPGAASDPVKRVEIQWCCLASRGARRGCGDGRHCPGLPWSCSIEIAEPSGPLLAAAAHGLGVIDAGG